MKEFNPKIPLSRALAYIFLSIVIVTGISATIVFYLKHLRERQKSDPQYQIVALVQTSGEAEELKTIYLAELLGLSIDRPQNIHCFNTKRARLILLSCPIIKEASIRKIKPGTIHVDYQLRKPVAFLGDYSNTVIDIEGMPFPFKPFFTPKKLPEIYLGAWDHESDEGASLQWGVKLQGEYIKLALTLLALIDRYCCKDGTALSLIDVSKAFARNYGQRQITVILEDSSIKIVEGRPLLYIYPRILRLALDNFHEQLANYLVLHKYLKREEMVSTPILEENSMRASACIVDLRLSQLAFIEKTL